MSNFMSQIFSAIITEYKVYITCLGFKISYTKKTADNTKEKYLKYSAFELPKAEGDLRTLQLAELKMLKLFDSFCSQNGIEYWLDHGTLLGAIRNKGFVTWDDDIDLGMMRDDYDKFINLMREGKELHKDLKIHFENNGRHMCMLKIVHKKVPHIQVDIFPYDYYYKKTSDESKKQISQNLTKIMDKKNYGLWNILYTFFPDKVRQRFKNITFKQILNEHTPDKTEKPSIFCGIDFPDLSRESLVYDYETILPVRRIQFEDMQALAPNDYEKILDLSFEDYTKLPNNCYPHHFGSEHLPKKIVKELNHFLKN